MEREKDELESKSEADESGFSEQKLNVLVDLGKSNTQNVKQIKKATQKAVIVEEKTVFDKSEEQSA